MFMNELINFRERIDEIDEKTCGRRWWNVGSGHKNDGGRRQFFLHLDRRQDAIGKWRHCPLRGGHHGRLIFFGQHDSDNALGN